MNFLVLDTGTSSMRGILFTEDGEVLQSEKAVYQVVSGENGRVEQDPEELLDSMTGIIKKIMRRALPKEQTVDAVVLTAQRSSLIPVDREGTPLGPAQMWQDQRAIPICQELEAYNEEIFRHSGSRVNPVFSGTKMRWLKRNEPEIYKKAWKLAVIPEYLLFHMTGKFCTDYTYGSRSHLMNLRECRWDPYLLDLFQIEEEKLCELKPPGSMMGCITEKFAAESMLPPGIPVISAGGDQQCGMIGQGVIKEGKMSLTLGTGGFLLTACRQVPDHLENDVVCNASSDAGAYILEANVLTCTSAMEWFRRNFYPGESGFYGKMNRILSEIPPGAGGCMALPYFQGRSTPDWNSSASALFCSLTLNTTREDMLKALLEGICMEISNNIRSFEKYVPVHEISAGGGLSRSEAFNQMQAEIYGRRILCPEEKESTAAGALMVAACTLGCYPDLEEAYAQICGRAPEKVYVPHPEIHEKYEEIRAKMNETYRRMWQPADKI